ncbi:hypothetical protein P152DRAFT_382179, partial [Eremomyces bilateralis CBS 781.70]
LPTEMHLEIISHLSIPSPQRLQQTSRHFCSLVKRPTLRTLLEEESLPWAREQQYLTCSECVKFRKRSSFADDMTVGEYSPGCLKASQRMCIWCALQNDKFPLGTLMRVGGRTHVVCLQCGRCRSEIGTKG